MKNGQTSGNDAALLILIIAAVLLTYILFLPPAERDSLLMGNETVEELGTDSSNLFLLDETPGTLRDPGSRTIEHPLSAFSIYTKSDASTIKEFPNIYVRSSSFSEKIKKFNFVTDAFIENAVLSFNIKESTGKLLVHSNGELVHTSSEVGNVEPITIQLQNNNELFFESEHPGWLFWQVNKHYLENVKLTGDVVDETASKAQQNFVITNNEKESLEKVEIRMVCSEIKPGNLDIFLNNNLVYSGVPECSGFIDFELTPENLFAGNNVMLFQTAGKYNIDQTTITTTLQEAIYPVYYFQISDSEFQNITAGGIATLRLKFLEDSTNKRGDIIINGRITRLDQKEDIYEKNISDFLEEGSNGLQIIPDDVLDIVSLKIELG